MRAILAIVAIVAAGLVSIAQPAGAQSTECFSVNGKVMCCTTVGSYTSCR